MRLGNKVALTLLVLVLWIRFGSNSAEMPDPERPSKGLAVVILEESEDRGKLPQSQLNILTSDSVREYLNEHCAKDDKGNPMWRIVDDDVSMENEPKVLQEGFAKVKAVDGRPAMGISNGHKGWDGLLPDNVDKTLAELKKWGGR